MGHKVSPVGMRIGINRDWNSKWFAKTSDGKFADYVNEDVAIRAFFEKKLAKAALSHIEIERSKFDDKVKTNINLYAARVGEIMGENGDNLNKIKAEFEKTVKIGKYTIQVVEVKNPDLDATLVAKWIASELENRAAFRGTMKKALMRMKKAGAKGCRTLCSGRLGGAEIARAEGYKEGVVPLHTVRADIDFAHIDAHTPYGRIGVKVWICRDLNKTGTEYVNEPAQGLGARPERGERRAPKGDK